jgi:hypothetical protein
MSTHDEYEQRFQAGNWKPKSERHTQMQNSPNSIPVGRLDYQESTGGWPRVLNSPGSPDLFVVLPQIINDESDLRPRHLDWAGEIANHHVLPCAMR